ncbi:MAG: class I SAM-dependent methyltransferase [Zoogloeaceae bacterium]|jgi:2-polyprenyl-3-methyl-5-hydroxy-6-metoxy-1,4-benzoquinol methylase|nr:class I SAM-dependent methyltransferase [Zoogloeaceae bacterium]
MTEKVLRQSDLAFQAQLYASSNPTRRWLHTTRYIWLMEAFRQYCPFRQYRLDGENNVQILEVGIGCAICTREIRKYCDVFAVDINPDSVEIMNGIQNIRAVQADITQPEFASRHAYMNQADIAICSEVLEHVADSRTALQNLHAALKPGGILILTTPNAWSTVEIAARFLDLPFMTRLASAIYGESVDALGHINRMTRRQLLSQIRSTGFEIVEATDTGFYLPLIAEFGSVAGQKICRALATWFAKSPFRWLCWTQCWILRKPYW